MIKKNSLKTSAFIYNSLQTKRKYQSWTKRFPWIQPFYAVKANNILPFMKNLVNEGSSFDCASKTQIELVMGLGANTDRIVYSNPTKDENDLEWAEKIGIKLTVADSIEELLKIRRFAPNMKILWRISIKEDVNDILTSSFSSKFGDDIERTDQIQKRMKEIKDFGFQLQGIHFHCGSGPNGASNFQKAVLNARQCIEVGRKFGHPMKVLDVGGGYPGGQINESTVKALNMTKNDPLGYQVISEPGRHLCCNSFYVLTKVIGKKFKNQRICYTLNDSVWHIFNGIPFKDLSLEGESQFYSVVNSETLKESEIKEKNISSLFGMTCCGQDVIAKNAHVPKIMEVGDWLCVGGMGAYAYAIKSEFNGMKSIQKIIPWQAQIN